MTMTFSHLDVLFPADLLADLERLAPPDQRNDIIVTATADYVHKLKTLRVLKETEGAWSTGSHPELATPEAMEHWLMDLRANWRTELLWPEEAPHG